MVNFVQQANGMPTVAQDRPGQGIGIGHRVAFAQPPRPARFPPVAPVPPLPESRALGLRQDTRSFGYPSPPRGLKSKKDLSGRADSSTRHGTSTTSSGSHGGMPDDTTSAVSASSGKQVLALYPVTVTSVHEEQPYLHIHRSSFSVEDLRAEMHC